MSTAALEQTNITRKPGAFEKRIHEIDFLRGFLILLVIMDHLFWCLKAYNLNWYFASGGNITSSFWDGIQYKETFEGGNSFFYWMYAIFNYYWVSLARDVVRYIALFGFCFLSGISSAFSRNNWVRAGQMIGVFAVILVGSNLLDASGILNQVTRIDFNVIGVLAFSTLFYCFVQNRSWKGMLAATLGLVLFWWYLLPWMAESPLGKGYAPALWAGTEIYADWMPLFPYIIFFFAGAIFSYFFYAPTKKSLISHRGDWERPFCFAGRHSLIIYLGHQFVLTPLFLLITLCLGY